MDDADLPPGGRPVGDPPWEAWTPAQITERLAGVPVPWCVAAGWALELFAGQVSREHEDLEIAVPAAGFAAVRAALRDLEFEVAGSGHLWPVDSPAFEVFHQTWGRDPGTGTYRVDVFREPHDGGIWICRRDESIRLPYDEVIRRSADGIPYLAPRIVLLFKAKHARPKDNADFAAALPRLGARERGWLTSALELAHPGHPWIAEAGAA